MKTRMIAALLLPMALCTTGCGGGDPIDASAAYSYITWTNSVNGELVVDASGDFVRFRSDTRNMVFGNTEYTNMHVNSTGATLSFNGTIVGTISYIKSVTGSTITGLLCSNGAYMDIVGTQANLSVTCSSVFPVPI